MLNAPRADFAVELHRALPDRTGRFKADSRKDGRPPIEATRQSAEGDLLSALRARGCDDPYAEPAVKGWVAVRDAISQYVLKRAEYEANWKWTRPDRRVWLVEPKLVLPPRPEGLDEEFDGYLRGAAAWHLGNIPAARKAWRGVMALPASRRRFRSVWAAYMLGRSYVGVDADAASRWFAACRDHARRGFSDRTHLAAASFGWEARAALEAGRYERAMDLYVDQYACGDRGALASLRVCANRAMTADPSRLAKLAGDELACGVVTAHLVAGSSPLWMASGRSGPKHVGAWLAAVEHAGTTGLAGASRLGWAAYRAGRMDLARRWTDRAGDDDVIACWIRAKLLLRAGEPAPAARQLARALVGAERQVAAGRAAGADRLADTLPWRAWRRWGDRRREMGGELAALGVGGGQYVDALRLLLRHQYGEPSDYLAERILTVDELRAFVDGGAPGDRFGRMREILAARLVRAGRWKEAGAYFDPEDRARLNDYVSAIRRGHRRDASRAERAEAFWEAATLAREYGRRLMGYVTAWYGSQTDGRVYPWPTPDRLKTDPDERYGEYTVVPVSADERARARRHAPRRLERWHYLYEAVGHAWRACELMPDDHAETARRLWTAGTWIKYLDPNSADRFYKALVRRCGRTELGRRAAEKHWFPKELSRSR